MKRAIVFAVILMCAHMCLATTIHVPADQPSIQAGIDASVDGDTVLVGPGEYYGGIIVYYKAIYLLSSGGPSLTILHYGSGYGQLINLFGASSQVSGFTFDGSCCGFASPAILTCNYAKAVISQNIFRGFHTDREVIEILSEGVVVDHNLFISNAGIACVGVRWGGRATITNNTIVGNNGGIYDYVGYPNHIRNNIICYSKGAGLMTASPELSDCNVLWNNHPNYAAGLAPGPHDITADPLFCDRIAGNFHLKANSPCAPANNNCGVLIGALPIACGSGRGDVDGNGKIEIADAVFLLTYFFNSGPPPLDANASDVTGDRLLNIADVVFLIHYVFAGGSAPSAVGLVVQVPADELTIQAGIDKALDGDTVLIADGHFYERINYRGKNIVVGSYFVRDGDSSHIINTLIDGDTVVLGKTDSASVVSFLSGEDSRAVLAGITIQNGIGTRISIESQWFQDRQGGGILCLDANPCIVACRIRDCRAYRGGGGMLAESHTRISNCSFLGNVADWGGGLFVMGDSCKIEDCSFLNNRGGGGGGMSIADYNVNIIDCVFVDNQASYGGGIWTDQSANAMALVGQCLFRRNNAREGGGIYQGDKSGNLFVQHTTFFGNNSSNGGAIRGSCVYAIGCKFVQNFAANGGAIWLTSWGDGHIGALDSCLFDQNIAGWRGGALILSNTCCGIPDIRACSFIRNSAPTASWVEYLTNQDVGSSTFENCLVAFNRGGPIVDPADSAWLLPTLSCTSIYGNSGGDWISYIASQAGSNGNFSANPLFCDTASGDFHLQSNSPCAPANNSCGVLIGALPVACAWGCGDIDGSGDVNVTDAVRLIYYLFVNGSVPLDLSGGDVNQDGRLNVADVVYMINYIFVGGPAPCAAGK
jgi:predicted outer membrane repeat protein